MVILGLDPGSRYLGWGVVELHETGEVLSKGFGTVTLASKWSLAKKLAAIFEHLHILQQTYRPDAMSLEQAFFGKNAHSAFILGQVRGVCLCFAGIHGLALCEYAPRKVKKHITGSGAANKEQVLLVIERLLGVDLAGEFDAADAVALAVTHAHHVPLSSLGSDFAL